jgi:hypothetical protein
MLESLCGRNARRVRRACDRFSNFYAFSPELSPTSRPQLPAQASFNVRLLVWPAPGAVGTAFGALPGDTRVACDQSS